MSSECAGGASNKNVPMMISYMQVMLAHSRLMLCSQPRHCPKKWFEPTSHMFRENINET